MRQISPTSGPAVKGSFRVGMIRGVQPERTPFRTTVIPPVTTRPAMALPAPLPIPNYTGAGGYQCPNCLGNWETVSGDWIDYQILQTKEQEKNWLNTKFVCPCCHGVRYELRSRSWNTYAYSGLRLNSVGYWEYIGGRPRADELFTDFERGEYPWICTVCRGQWFDVDTDGMEWNQRKNEYFEDGSVHQILLSRVWRGNVDVFWFGLGDSRECRKKDRIHRIFL